MILLRNQGRYRICIIWSEREGKTRPARRLSRLQIFNILRRHKGLQRANAFLIRRQGKASIILHQLHRSQRFLPCKENRLVVVVFRRTGRGDRDQIDLMTQVVLLRVKTHFHARYAGNALVIDKWFSLQAGSLNPQALAHAEALADHPDFTLHNPNRVRALYMALAANGHAFHDASGKGYRMIADLIIALDPSNAQTAARFVAPLGRWRRIEPGRAAMMRAELERIAAAPALSRDTLEQVSKSLG